MGSGIERDSRELLKSLRRDIRDERVLAAVAEVPRESFVPPEVRHMAYKDMPLPIGESQTISQPYIVALMISLLDLRGSEKVMEVGTGSGYQAALLARMVPQGSVLSLERIPSLATEAAQRVQAVGCRNVDVKVAGTTLGCPEESPFDAIVVAAASPRMPRALLDQMRIGGRMIIPVGTLKEQELSLVLRTSEGHSIRMMGPCRFVPLLGEDAWPEDFQEI